MSVESTRQVSAQVPIEIQVAIFQYLDGRSLGQCLKVCRHWYRIIHEFQDLIWALTASTDFDYEGISRFWRLSMQNPRSFNDIGSFRGVKRTWADVYRINTNWYKGNCDAYFPTPLERSSIPKAPHAVVGIPQEGLYGTMLHLGPGGRVARYNPVYRNAEHDESEARDHTVTILQNPETGDVSIINSKQNVGISSQFTHPLLDYMITGDIDGNVTLRDLEKQEDIITWSGHRGRVLCVSMNENVAVSGGSDCTLRVWDIGTLISSHKHWGAIPGRHNWRGTIDISQYLSPSSEWSTGVGELAMNDTLIACSSDSTAPILIFSLLTGALVYQLKSKYISSGSMFSHLCMTPFFLLTKGQVSSNDDGPRRVHGVSSEKQERKASHNREASRTRYGYVTPLNESTINLPPQPNLSAYQLQQLLRLNNTAIGNEDPIPAQPESRGCINVWDLRTGKIIYRLVPDTGSENIAYTSITDIRTTPDFSKVVAVLCDMASGKERVFTWDFTKTFNQPIQALEQELFVAELDGQPIEPYSPAFPRVGKSWTCYM